METKADRLLREYVEDRDKATLKCIEQDTVEPFKELIKKYTPLGFFPPCFALPKDEVLAISVRKVAYHSINLPQKIRDQAGSWLIENGYSTDLD